MHSILIVASIGPMFRVARFAFMVFFPGAIAGLVAEGVVPPRPGENHTIPELALTLVWIKPGSFFMSDPHGTADDTWVTLSRGYWLGRTELTQAQWQAVARHIPVYENTPLPSFFKGSERPVENVTWDMAVLFCAKLTELERAAGRLPAGYAYRLPTEAQWEYACRAGTTGKYAGELVEIAWYDANSGGTTHPVTQKKPNAWGLYDMQGNVSEWCADWYGGYPGDKALDPAGPATGVYRVLRGGCFGSSAGACRSAVRYHWQSWFARNNLGFRLALAPVTAAAPRAPTGATSP